MIDHESGFAAALAEVVRTLKPRKILETGTFYGDGSTRIIADALRESGVTDYEFYTIEVNPVRAEGARRNLADTKVLVENGLTVRRDMLPGFEEIGACCAKAEELGMTVDYDENERRQRYFEETDFCDVPEEMLATVLDRFDGRPDFVLLDSAGHMGYLEFNYLLERLRGSCVMALDDIKHVKHYKSFQQILKDPRFTILSSDDEDRFGFGIVRFDAGEEA
jgi:hypothetical protein